MINTEKYQNAIILNVHYTGANMALVTLFSETEGLKKGIVKVAKKRQAELQKGNIIEFIHFKRKEDQLGTIKFNLIEQTFIKYFDSLAAMRNLEYIVKLLLKFLKENISYDVLYVETIQLLKQLEIDSDKSNFMMVLFEYKIIKDLGYGLDLYNILTVDKSDKSPAYYVSPKSARIVSEKLGEPYKDKLLLLPKIYGGTIEKDQINLAFKINKFLISKM